MANVTEHSRSKKENLKTFFLNSVGVVCRRYTVYCISASEQPNIRLAIYYEKAAILTLNMFAEKPPISLKIFLTFLTDYSLHQMKDDH